VKIHSSDKSELMNVLALERRDNKLIIKGKIMGAMPMTAVLTPEQARKGLKLLNPRLGWFLLSFLFRRSD
jgi:hypothetical protein